MIRSNVLKDNRLHCDKHSQEQASLSEDSKPDIFSYENMS